MFGQNKPTAFGTPFAASGSATPGFGSNAFAQSTPTTGGLFGQSTSTAGTGTGLFGGSGGSAFGQQSSGGFNFGNTAAGSGSLFGQKTTANTGLFGTPAATSTNTFGFGASGGFGTTTTTASTGGLFGTSGGTGVFGAANTGFGQPQSGTTVKYNPPSGQDTMVKNGVTQTINTKHQCITAMKEYEDKSLEELRVEDYTAGRKGKQAGAGGFGFGGTAAVTTAPATGFAFGQAKPTGFGTATPGFGTSTSTGNTSLFGQSAPASGGLFGQNKSVFGNTTTTTQSGFGFGTNTSTGAGGLFGQAQQNKPLFGTTTTTQPSLFGTGTTSFGTPAASSTGFGGFGTTTQTGGLFGNKPAFGAQTATSTGLGTFGSNTGSNLFAKPFSAPSTGFGFNTATTSSGFGGTQQFGAVKPTGFGLNTTSTAPAFNFGGGGLNTGTSLFGNTLNKPGGLGSFGTTGTAGFGSFGNATTSLGTAAPALGGTMNQVGADQTAQLQQTLLALTQSPYGDSPLFWNMKDSKIKREEVLKPTNPVAQKAILANQHKVSPRPMAKIKPKALSGSLNGSKAQIFEGLEEDDFSFGSDTFQPRKSVKKLTLKKGGQDSSTHSRASSVSGEPQNVASLRDDDHFRGRSSPVGYSDQRRQEVDVPETENIIRSKGISDQMADTPDRRPNMDDTIAMLNAQNKSSGVREPVIPQSSQDDTVNISIISRDESTNDDVIIDERPMTPPPPHPAGLMLTRPGYYTIPSLEALSEKVDEDGNCFVEDFTIGREGYGSIFFPGVTNVANMNFDETVFFRRKEVIVYPDDDNKPDVGEGLNKKAEITLDCVWPRDKSIGTPIKSPEKLKAMRWQDKIEENSLKVGAKFIDYRPETGSWVFEVKHFSKYGLVDDSDEEDMPEQDKKRLRLAQQQQMAVQKQKLHLEQMEKQRQKGPPKPGVTNGQAKSGSTNGQVAKFTVGTDDDSDGSGTLRTEVPMGDDDNQLSETPKGGVTEIIGEMDDDDDMEVLDEQPSSHRLATSMGVDARNMQVMKASFFGDEDAPAPAFDGGMFSKKQGLAAGSPLLRKAEGGGPSLFSSALKSKYMSPVKIASLPQKESAKERGLFSPRLITPEPVRAMPSPQTFHPPVKEYMLLESGMTQQDYQQRVVGSRVAKVIPMVTESFTYQKQGLLVDAGLFMGRSFRVGWGPGWTLAHSGDIVQPKDLDEQKTAGAFSLFSGGQKRTPTQGSSSWNVHLQKVNIADHLHSKDKTVLQNHREMLEIQLVHSRNTKEGNCPVFTPAVGVEALHQYAERNQDELETLGAHPDEENVKHMGMVWDLCVALWGNMPEFKDMDIERDSYMYQNGRREAFSRWLSSVSGEIIKQEVQGNKYKEQGHLQAILSCLTGHQVTEACNLAQKSGDHRLALLLAQAVSNYITREMVTKQLEEYIEFSADDNINETRLKIYSLLAGQLVLLCNSMTVNTCEGLDWKRSLALHLWFCCRVEAPLQDAVELYERAFKGSNDNSQYSCPPLPPYLESSDSEEIEKSVRDTCYHLLCLYCQKCHQLERLLNPITSTPNHLDYRLSWHLSQVLQSLSYNHLSAYHRASLHMSFASHLESLNLWEWAVFVALHIENQISRESAVCSLLDRHVRLTSSESYLEKEELLIERLHVPVEWIHSAKALRANYECNTKEEAWHLLKAGQWNRSHDVIMKHIAPDTIIHERYDYLHEMLMELAVPVRCATILDWPIAGSVYLEYINICFSMKQISQAGEPNMYELDKLLPEVKSLCTKVASIPCRNPKDRLCQSEMAKKAANFLRLILTFQAEANGESQPSIRLMAPYISNLPMPEDYTLQNLRALTRSYMKEQTVS